jgi:hypothetical protein
MSELSITQILQLDWTADDEESKEFLKIYSFADPAENGERFLASYKRFLISRNGCHEFGQQDEDTCIGKLETRDFRITIERKRILELLHFFRSNDVIATKVCFGFDKALRDGGKMQFIISGTFWRESIGLEDEEIKDRLFTRGGAAPYFLNFDILNKISPVEFAKLHDNLSLEVLGATNLPADASKAVFGYVLSTRTFLSMLEKEDQFGTCATIDFDISMNTFELDEETGKLLMVKLHSTEKSSPIYWLFDSEFIPNSGPDDLTCPPREPCNSGGTGG